MKIVYTNKYHTTFCAFRKGRETSFFMYGAILGDIAGSRFEFSKPDGFHYQKVDLFAKKMYVNRTSAVAFLLANSLEEFDFQNKNKKEDLVL